MNEYIILAILQIRRLRLKGHIYIIYICNGYYIYLYTYEYIYSIYMYLNVTELASDKTCFCACSQTDSKAYALPMALLFCFF